MGLDHYELGIAGGTGVSATMLVFATLLCLWEIKHQLKNINYASAQYCITFLLTAPIFIGWLNFGILYNPGAERIITSFLSGYKAAYLLIFAKYCDQILGWVNQEGNNIYSAEESIKTLQNLGEVKHFIKRLGVIKLSEYDQAKSFIIRTKLLVLQLIVILIVTGILILILVYATPDDYVDYGNYTLKSSWVYMIVVRDISVIVAAYAVLMLSFVLTKVPRLARLHILAKFCVVKFAILIPEFQSIIIAIFADKGAISYDYSDTEQVAFVNGLLVCYEMVITAFVQLMAFDPSEYGNDKQKIGHELEDKDDIRCEACTGRRDTTEIS